MIVLACADDNFGMLFNGRRQSQDRLLRSYILKMTKQSRLWMNAYSRGQFDKTASIVSDEEFLSRTPRGDFCFLEDQELLPYRDRVEKVILFRWNRRYPADFYFDRRVLAGWKMRTAAEFPGSSHEKITREDYEP
ncbi:MAG TPA: ribonuclease Z [Candidatus Scatomonas pullistercoris]|uniref:Ribonuclease Z n=1 Tax=Candidatus Scatomonas pullistercoris TaxID=2840920 RepID=A0A9D1P3G8_9FIRM|nr:ribonuclease Z [Candidatus Scatomonas pullistercoris]